MKLLERLKTGFSSDADEQRNQEHDVQIAAAVLLLEMEHADHEHSPDERVEISRQLKAYFDLDDDEVTTLLAAAQPHAKEAVSLHRFLQALNKQLSAEQRRRVLEMLWRVAYADSELHAREEGLLRHIADLLHLPHREFMKSKFAVTEQR